MSRFEIKLPKIDRLPIFLYEKELKNGTVKPCISPSSLAQWLHTQGYCYYDKSLIRLNGNIAEEVDSQAAYREALNYVMGFGASDYNSLFMTSGAALITNRNSGIILGLPETSNRPLLDTKTIAYKFFRNTVVKLTKDKEWQLLEYDELDGFVWRSQIIDHDFWQHEDIDDSDFNQFIINISNDDEMQKSLISGLGYLLHRYKDPSRPKAVIIQDENLDDNGAPQGGTGKGLLVKAVAQFMPTVYENGKNSSFDSVFAFQKVSRSTSIISIDDADKAFKLEQLFSVITDDITVERKHQQPIEIPYHESPKFVITTNYTIRGRSSSFARRRFDVYLNGYYGEHRQPVDDFGKDFFTAWESSDWNKFYNVMLAFLDFYLTNGLITYSSGGIKEKILKNETSKEFWECMQASKGVLNVRHSKSTLKAEIIQKNPNRFMKELSDAVLKRWIDAYAEFQGVRVEHGRSQGGSWYELQKVC